MTITVIGLDLAKSVFQIHGIDATGQPKLKRKLRRSEVLTLGLSRSARRVPFTSQGGATRAC
jgi:transposase